MTEVGRTCTGDDIFPTDSTKSVGVEIRGTNLAFVYIEMAGWGLALVPILFGGVIDPPPQEPLDACPHTRHGMSHGVAPAA